MICLRLHSWGLKRSACTEEGLEIEAAGRRQRDLAHLRGGSLDERHWEKKSLQQEPGTQLRMGKDRGKQLLSPCHLYTSFVWKNACCGSDPACSTPQGPAQCWSTLTAKPPCCLLDMFGVYRLNAACTPPNTHSSNPTSLKPSIPQPTQYCHQQTTTP